jgi:hypothetical protein
VAAYGWELAEQFIISLYLVEYPSANGAFGRVSFSSNCLKFNGYDCLSLTISEPTRLATTSHGWTVGQTSSVALAGEVTGRMAVPLWIRGEGSSAPWAWLGTTNGTNGHE